MNQLAETNIDLRRTTREIFYAALRRVDPAPALSRVVQFDKEHRILCVGGSEFDLGESPKIYSIAIGKAARRMARALSDALSDELAGGVISTPLSSERLPACWKEFAGGHPLPNAESFAAAQAAFELLRRANEQPSLVIFLISGGGSAMMELPRNPFVTLEDLREANRILTTCGAKIGEINAVRRRLARVKGGGLSAALSSQTKRVTLLVSDTNAGEEANVASGPTFRVEDEGSEIELVARAVERYELRRQLPASVMRALNDAIKTKGEATGIRAQSDKDARGAAFGDKAVALDAETDSFHLLLDNQSAKDAAVDAARARGFLVERADDIVEQNVEVGCAELVARLFALKDRAGEGAKVCLISGGEFVCPVRGKGVGGRNAEAALRTAFEFDKRRKETNARNWQLIALHAGTDGVDGNSPAAGAIADETTIVRARALGLDAETFLINSDAYSFFKRLGDTIETGATGTNVRDLRILLAC